METEAEHWEQKWELNFFKNRNLAKEQIWRPVSLKENGTDMNGIGT